jgi:hypothetical protein
MIVAQLRGVKFKTLLIGIMRPSINDGIEDPRALEALDDVVAWLGYETRTAYLHDLAKLRQKIFDRVK